jgi:integrase
MPTRINLTEKRIKDELAKAEATEGVEVRMYDSEVSNLVLWRRPGGRARWYVFGRRAGAMKRVPVGDINTWPEVPVETARKLARVILVAMSEKKDPVAQRRAERETARGGKFPLSDLLTHVITRMETLGRASRHTNERKRIGEALIEVGVKDLSDPRACAIAEKWINAQECGDLTKHRYGTHVRALGRAALKRYPDLNRDPFRALEVGSAELPPPAMFTLDALVRLTSDEAMTTWWGKLFSFLLYTGCRYREGAYARWSRLDTDAAAFSVLPPSQDERAAGEAVKRNRGRSVTLQPELVEILKGWPKPHGDFIFHDDCRTKSGDTTQEFRAHLSRLGIPLGDLHIHSLRHAHCTLSVACGVPDMQLRLSVGHGGPAMTSHYANAAMLWRGKLKDWKGTFRLRDSVEVGRVAPTAAKWLETLKAATA